MKASIFNIQKFSLHDGPGIRTVVFFKGCPLRCKWCANPESFQMQPEPMWDPIKKQEVIVGEYKEIGEIIKEVLRDIDFYEESGGGVTLSGGEALAQSDVAIELLKALKSHGIHTTCETAGYAALSVFKEFIKYIDLLLFDIKHYDSENHLVGTGVSNEIILKNLAFAAREHPNLLVRIPIIPRYNDTLKDAVNFAMLLADLGIKRVELLPFHQLGEAKYQYLGIEYELPDLPQLHSEDLVEYQKVIEKYNIDCLIG